MMDYQKIALLFVLALAILLMLRALLRRDKDAASALNLEDLLLGEDGKMSKAAAVMFVALVITSWVVLYQTLKGTLTDVSFGAYLAAWVAPTVTRLITNRPTS